MKISTNKLKNGFTIAEAVICFTLMGIVFIATISNVNTNNNYYKMYYNAYSALSQAAYEAYNETLAYYNNSTACSCKYSDGSVTVENASGYCWAQSCWRSTDSGQASLFSEIYMSGGGGENGHTREYPGYLYGYEGKGSYDGTGTDESFCQLFTKNINMLSSASNCKSFISKHNNNKDNFLEAFCDATLEEVIGEDGPEYKMVDCEKMEPTFVASNGQKFYISSVTTANSYDSNYGNQDSRESYRFIVVDLNGNRGPNRQYKQGDALPDLVIFALDSKGNVIPLGLPEFNLAYIDAYVKYPQYNASGEENTVLKSETTTLDTAKKLAWGFPLGDVSHRFNQAYSTNIPLSKSSTFYFNAAHTIANSCLQNNENVCKDKEIKNKKYTDDLYLFLVDYFTRDISFDGISNQIAVKSEYGCTSADNINSIATCNIDYMH